MSEFEKSEIQEVYHKEFDEVLKIYNENQKRADRRTDDYFEHISKLDQDMAVEIIIQCGDKEFWVANAVIHFDEASPHMHVVGVPVHEGYAKGLSKRVSKRNVFTQESMSLIIQGELREFARQCFRFHLKENFSEKKKGRNQDLSVLEYKVAKETEKLENLEGDIGRSRMTLAEIKGSIAAKNTILEYTQDELEEKKHEVDRQIKGFIGMFQLFAPTIEEYATAVEKEGGIDAGNSYRGVLYELGKLLERFKELIKEGLCWFSRLMRWKTSMGEVASVFRDTDNGYSYSVCGYMNVETMEQYSKEAVQSEIRADRRVGTVETMEANVEAMERDLAEILRLDSEQERLWKAYEKGGRFEDCN